VSFGSQTNNGDCVPLRDVYLARRLSPKRAMADIESPCNKVCVVDPISALCIGCGRSLAEIEGWLRLLPEQRARVMADLPQRLSMLARRHAAPADIT
jgi:predicted Fe-S protein YdhL (DUF1289 family)